MGTSQSKEIPQTSPLGCILTHWKELVGCGGKENKKTLTKFCTQWWPLYKLEEGVRWPPAGTVDYETLLQLLLFLRREQRWEEVTYADLFISLRNHPEWQRDCAIQAPSNPLALEKDNKINEGKPERCCSSCSINPRCTHPDEVYPADSLERELRDLFKPPPKRRGELAPTSPPTSFPRGPTPIPAPISPLTWISMPTPAPAASTAEPTPVPPSASISTSISPTPSRKKTPKALLLPSSGSEGEELLSPEGPVASHTQKQTKEIIKAPLREAVSSEGKTILVKIPFSLADLEAWEKIAKHYRSDPIGVAKKFRFVVKQHRLDWFELQLLLSALTETEKQLVLKAAGSLAEDACKNTQMRVKDVFPLQDPQWDPNDGRKSDIGRTNAQNEEKAIIKEEKNKRGREWLLVLKKTEGHQRFPA
ncbi:uncharacterized protein LOC121660483 [Corvus kubaryi]|uniref:uncharacterized protein LOC121660483 n=1 Tax=Corvus kubaryi TaxID=68294 RepID=UPI001C058474|nr:uncharacterized protein LOC121660483 [Corvus kubaryi]